MSFFNMSDCLRNDKSFDNVKNNDSINIRPKRMYCHDCGEYTQSIELIIIRRYNTYVFAIFLMCNQCNKLKQS